MNKHVFSEIRMLNQIILGIMCAANIGYFLSLNIHSFPGLSYMGIAIGIVIISVCWIGKQYFLFYFGLISTTLIFTIVYEWSTIFHL